MSIHQPEGFTGQRLIVVPDTSLNELALHSMAKFLLVTDIGFFPNASHHYRSRPNGSPSHIFILCVKGGGWVEGKDGSRSLVNAGSWMMIPGGTSHAYGANAQNPWSIYWFHCRGSYVDALVSNLALGAENFFISPFPIHWEPMTQLFEETYSLLESGFSAQNLLTAGTVMAHLLGLLVFGTANCSEGHDSVVEHTITYMRGHIEDRLGLGELAHQAGLGRTQFIKRFKAATGKTPIDYLLRLRLQRACQYLDLTAWSVQEVAQAVGVNDAYYFSRLFHKIMGQSPSQYRQTKKG